MKRSELIQLIREVITETISLREVTSVDSLNTTGEQPPTSTNPTQDQTPPEQTQMPEAERIKLEKLKIEQSKLTDDVRNIDGKIEKLEEPVKRQVQKLQLEKSKAQQKLGSITKQVTTIQSKYSK